jgi:hypothetical protein
MSAIVMVLDGAKMTAKIIRLTVPAPAPSPTRDSLFFASAHFVSMCPTCKDNRSQLGYSSGGLLRRLNGNRLIEAYCAICNHFWPITAEERARLAGQFEHLRLS